MYSDAKAHYAELKDREESLREEHQAVVDRYSSEIKELKSARLEIRRLTNEIQLSELLLKKLKIDIKARTSKLEADTASEEKRRAAMAKDTEGQSKRSVLEKSRIRVIANPYFRRHWLALEFLVERRGPKKSPDGSRSAGANNNTRRKGARTRRNNNEIARIERCLGVAGAQKRSTRK